MEPLRTGLEWIGGIGGSLHRTGSDHNLEITAVLICLASLLVLLGGLRRSRPLIAPGLALFGLAGQSLISADLIWQGGLLYGAMAAGFALFLFTGEVHPESGERRIPGVGSWTISLLLLFATFMFFLKIDTYFLSVFSDGFIPEWVPSPSGGGPLLQTEDILIPDGVLAESLLAPPYRLALTVFLGIFGYGLEAIYLLSAVTGFITAMIIWRFLPGTGDWRSCALCLLLLSLSPIMLESTRSETMIGLSIAVSTASAFLLIEAVTKGRVIVGLLCGFLSWLTFLLYVPFRVIPIAEALFILIVLARKGNAHRHRLKSIAVILVVFTLLISPNALQWEKAPPNFFSGSSEDVFHLIERAERSCERKGRGLENDDEDIFSIMRRIETACPETFGTLEKVNFSKALASSNLKRLVNYIFNRERTPIALAGDQPDARLITACLSPFFIIGLLFSLSRVREDWHLFLLLWIAVGAGAVLFSSDIYPRRIVHFLIPIYILTADGLAVGFGLFSTKSDASRWSKRVGPVFLGALLAAMTLLNLNEFMTPDLDEHKAIKPREWRFDPRVRPLTWNLDRGVELGYEILEEHGIREVVIDCDRCIEREKLILSLVTYRRETEGELSVRCAEPGEVDSLLTGQELLSDRVIALGASSDSPLLQDGGDRYSLSVEYVPPHWVTPDHPERPNRYIFLFHQ
ncbi:hypothetical protein ACFL4G_03190 [Thermodesulfobacteriota bacterium]